MRHIVLFFTFLLGLFIAGCSLLPAASQSAENQAAVPIEEAPIQNTPLPQITPDPSLPVVVTETRRLLTVWLPVDLAPLPDTGPSIMEQQIQNFATSQVDLDIKIEYKTVSGEGSTLNYLRTGRTVAPSILPDLIVLRMDQLETAVIDELIFPLNGLIDPTLLEDLYPTALDYAVQEEQVPGYPFSLTGVTHLAYNTATISDTIPTEWDMFRTIANGNFVFPANGEGGATLLLQMYLSNGGRLINEAGQTALQIEPLAQSLEQLNLARNDGFLVRQSNTLSSFDGAWEIYETGTANIAVVDANTYLSMRSEETETAVSPIPGLTNEITPFINGWAWAISTNEPTQQQLAAELLNHLISPELLSDWSLQTNHLPARRSAFDFWPDDDPYTLFIQSQLERAVPQPFLPGSDIIRTLRTTVFNVVNLTETPQEAAEAAVNSINP